ncbi:Rer1 family protein [Euphorbia peplus]|nr:Rer1 family protein [Euphorbia peplus]
MQTATALLLPWSPCTLAQTRPNNVSIIRLSFPNQAQFSWPRNTTTFSLNCSLNEGLPQDPGKGFWNNWKVNSAEMRSKLAKLGLAAVLAYGLFDGVTYTSFFVLAFLGYEKSTGNNPAANLKALLGNCSASGGNLIFGLQVMDGASLPTKDSDEFKPFIRRLPEFKFWQQQWQLHIFQKK